MNDLNKLVRRLDADGIRPVVVVSHPRSGTHLLMDTLRLNFRECCAWKLPGEPLERLYVDLDGLIHPSRLVSWNSAGKVLRRCPRPIIKTHAFPDFENFCLGGGYASVPPVFVDWLRRRADFLYVYRHVRSAMCSLHQFVQGHDPAAPEVPISEFIRQQERGASRVRQWARHIEMWLKRSDVYAVKMEELLQSPGPTITALGERLGLEPATMPPHLPTAPKTNLRRRLGRLFGIRPLSTTILGDPEGERPKNPRTAFDPDDMKYIRREVGDLLFRLTYETADEWASPLPDSVAETATGVPVGYFM